MDVEEKNCIASEKAVLQGNALQQYKRGDIVSVKIRTIVPFGAFGSIVDAQTGQMTGGEVSVHVFYDAILLTLLQVSSTASAPQSIVTL